MSELRDRLEALATRGTRRGADAVLNAAQRDAQVNEADPSDADAVEMSFPDDDLPVIALESTTRRRRRFGSFVASAGIAALVGVGALAITAMFGSGGAGSPEGAVRQLADAINHKDALAAVDVLAPSEVRTLRETVNGATRRAAELRIVNEASQPLAGVDLSVDHLELTTESLGDGYAKVIVTSGEISANAHRAQLSALLQKAMRNNDSDPQSKADLTKLAADSDLPTFVVVVRQGGGWYVSPAYTALEYAREIDDGPVATFGSAHPADLGADTPEAAVSDALRAWQAANWDRLIALAPPDELPAYDYRAWIRQAFADIHPDFTIDNLSTSAAVNGDRAVVKLEASGTMGSDPVRRWQVGGTCPAPYSDGWFGYSRSYDGSSASGSADSNLGLCLAGDLGRTLPFGLMALGPVSDTSTSGPVSIEVVREDGRWFVSPVSTALDLLDSAIEHVDQRTVYTLLGIAYDLTPDGTITLDQPFQVSNPTSTFAGRVYAFEGQAGQELVGGSSSASSDYSASGEIYTADGDDVGYVEFGSYPSTVKLPRSGSYRLVMEPFGVPGGETTLTLWDLAHAPKSLRDQAGANGETCTRSGGFPSGGMSCSASATATSIPSNPLGSGSANSDLLPSCAVTNNTLKCGDLTVGQICPKGTAPSVTIDCVPPELANRFENGQSPAPSPAATISMPPPTSTASAPTTTTP